jgi:tetratricopeptide (TPR) repeat protein
VEFSPDGRTVAVVKADYGLYLLRVPTLQEIDGRNDQPQRPMEQLLAEPGPGLQPVEGSAVSAIKRGDLLAEQGNFRGAAAAFSEGLQVAPREAVLIYKHALSCVGMGDSQPWRKAVNGICETPGLSESGDNAGLALWACALAVDGFADYARVLDLARAAATRTNGANAVRDVLTLGALLYRAGRYPEALQKLNEAAELRVKTGSELLSPAYAFYFLAMTQAGLGHEREARDAFRHGLAFDPAAGATARATELNPPWNRRLTLNLLRSEAERVLASNPAR